MPDVERDRVIVVTGASRGAGKGIALGLAGPGTATAEEITARGGVGIPVVCDHADDDQVGELFERVRREHGRLDVLVNNALVVHDDLTRPGPFWEKPLSLQVVLDVGTRSSY